MRLALRTRRLRTLASLLTLGLLSFWLAPWRLLWLALLLRLMPSLCAAAIAGKLALALGTLVVGSWRFAARSAEEFLDLIPQFILPRPGSGRASTGLTSRRPWDTHRTLRLGLGVAISEQLRKPRHH